MFNAIAPRYQFVNRLFSGGRDAHWRRKAVDLVRVTPADEVLDVATGTGDFARVFEAAGAHLVVGCDFARDMLRRAVEQSDGKVRWCEADALHLPFRDGSFSIVSCAFGVRNFSDLDVGLAEMYRALRSGGRAVILEFTRPTNRVCRFVYELYANRFMPVAASWISGDRSGAYRYLPRSVVSFPERSVMCDRLKAVGFSRVSTHSLTAGVVTIYLGIRS